MCITILSNYVLLLLPQCFTRIFPNYGLQTKKITEAIFWYLPPSRQQLTQVACYLLLYS